MRYRSRTDIAAMMLRAANNGATKTRLMYSAYVSYAQMKEYMQFLMDKSLLMHEEGSSLYRLTERGASFLRAYDQIRELVSVNNMTAPRTGNDLGS